MALPEFDPSKPFKVVGGDVPEFDPSKPFDVVKPEPDSWGTTLGKSAVNGLIGFKEWFGGRIQSMGETPPEPAIAATMGEQERSEYQNTPMAKAIESSASRPGSPAHFGKSIYDAAAEDIKNNAPNVPEGSAKQYAGMAVESLVQMIPTLALSFATKSPAGLLAMGEQTAGQQYGQARNESGRTPEQARADATFYALAETIPEETPLGILMKPGGKFLPRLLKTMGAEAVQEMFTQVLESGYDKATVSPDMTWGDAWKQVKAAGIVGGIVGGGMTVAHLPFHQTEEQAAAEKPPEAAPAAEGRIEPPETTPGATAVAPAASPNPQGWEINHAATPPSVANAAEEALRAAPAPLDAALPSSTVPPAQKVSIDKVLNAGSVDEAIAAASETAKTIPGAAPNASLDEIIDQTRKSFDEVLPNPQQDKLVKLFNGFNTGTVQKADDGMLEYKTADGAVFPLQVWKPGSSAPNEGGISPELADAQVKHYKDLGVDVVYIRDDKNIPFDGVVDPTQPNTIFLSSNPTRNAAQVGQHEITHVFENTTLPDGTSLADLMQQQIAEGITNQGIEHAYTLFGDTAPDRASFPNTPEGQAQHADAVLAHLFTELGADIGGEAPKFATFVPRVMNAVEARYGNNVAADVFQKFMDGIRQAIETLRTFFKGGETVSQNWVTNLEQVHGTLAEMYAAKYGEVAKLPETPKISPEDVIKMAEQTSQPPTRAGPAPQPGYEEAKTRVQTYQRWLGELDEQRKAEAEKSPEVAALRNEESTIIGKVRDERYLTKTARTRLARIRADLETRLNPAEDSEDMALVREKLLQAQQVMADKASVSKKYAVAPSAPSTGEPVRIGKRLPETGNPDDADRFVANQIAQDTGSSARFSPKVSEEPKPVFYSALERAVSETKTEKAAPGQWLATIRNTPGIKADEIKSTGLDKWLNAQTGPVTKADVIGHLQAHAVQIEEVTKGVRPPEAETRALIEKLEQDYEARTGKSPFEPGDRKIATYAFENSKEGRQWNNALDAVQKGTSPTKFEQYKLPGGQNYRELLLTLPQKPNLPEGWRLDKINDGLYKVFDDKGVWMTSGTSAEEAVKKADEGSINKGFKSNHWDEPNVLAHMRFDDRTGPNGEKILHVAEIQSDWHQKGRREGYKDPENVDRLQQEAKAAGDELFALRDAKILDATSGKYASKTEALDAGDKEAFNKIKAIESDPEVIAATEKHNLAVEAYRRAATGVLEAPFKNTWHELAFKRLLRHAVDNGYDRISWDTGQTNADRYDLSQQVSEIRWMKRRDGTYDIDVRDLDGENIASKKRQTAAQLSDLIGKDPADRIMNEEGRETRWTSGDLAAAGKLTGDGLKVGGEGMKGFYDKILPDFVNKYTKKWGGAVERSVLSDNRDFTIKKEDNGLWSVMGPNGFARAFGFDREQDAQDKADDLNALTERGETAVHSLTITPAMRAAIAQGQPKFSPKVKQTETPEFKRWFGDSKVVDAKGEPLRVYHGTASSFDIFKSSPGGWYGDGIYFTDNPEYAADFAADMAEDGETGSRTIPVYLSLQRPYVFREKLNDTASNVQLMHELGFKDKEINRAFSDEEDLIGDTLKEWGHDGIIVLSAEGRNEYVVFDPRQIKSAVGNSGAFDGRDPRLVFSPKAKPTVKDLQKEVPGLNKVVKNLTPEEVKDVSQRTAEKLVKLFSNLPSSEETAAVAYSGRAKRGWYQHSAQAIVDVFGQQDGSRFASLLAALSPQTSVESNLENALRMWVNWDKAGRPTDPKKIGQLLGQSVQGTGGEASVLDAWRGNSIRALTDADPGRPDFMLSGPKVNSFAKNLRNEVNEVTNDAWMATYAAIEPEMLASRRLENRVDNIGKSFGFKSPGYVAMSAMVRDAAKILTRKTGQRWTPAEVQETVWSWAKTLYERRDRAGEYRTAQQILKAADMTHEDVTSTPDFAVLLTRGIYRKILEGGKYAEAIAALEKSRGGDSTAVRPSGPSVSVTGAEGSGFAQSAFERHLQRAAARLERIRTDRRTAEGVNPRELIGDARDSEIAANMSAATNTIPGIAQLATAANAGDESAARLVNLIAHESLERLVATVPDAKLEVSRNGGLYGGSLEPSLGVKITFPEKRRGGVLAALAKFASNFNQEQIHVRQPTIEAAGRVFTDGSYATPVYTFELEGPLSRADIEQVIADSGLYGLNFSDKKLEAYFVGDPRDENARAEFAAAIERARDSLGERARSFGRSTARLWAYGVGEGATAGYDAIAGDVPRGASEHTEIPRAIAERDLGHEIETSDQADEITEAQRLLQSRIADHYEQLPDNDMSNPDVRRAYEELAKEIKKQYSALPIKVDVWTGSGEPYKSSADMRRDVLDNNHMWIFGTSTDTFGPPGADFSNHPLLDLTGRVSDNGYPLVVNDELRAVHDYYAHMLSPATFGPKGEEAAWKNHLATIDNPWARWALTSETRGQNSWVNFGAHVEPGSKLADRPFARQKAALLPVEHMLTGNEAIDYPTDEFIRTLPDFARNGSLPREANDPFPEFSPRVPSSLREKLIRKDPAYKAMFADAAAPKKQLAIGALPAAPVSEEEKPPRRKSLQPIEGTGAERERAINGALYNVGEEAPQMARATAMADADPDRAMAIAMLEQRPPAGTHPEFFYMAMEEKAQLEQDYTTLERLSRSRIAEEATTMGQRIAAWRNRMELSPLDDMQKIRQAREARMAAKGIDPETKIEEVVDQARNFIRKGAKSTKKPNWNDFIASIQCRT